ncbi:hypothetical protein F511_36433 [Dorcoceras hygrometricum]|uniref:Uncharacterized protein n=1 Tax=Dorcoceras hygrometricum TaxID=472368 RepID=A0A2Z7CTE2_9LAMI|nr:hypothetical protein F511_36433 [Dorcoceras hygrometricum]
MHSAVIKKMHSAVIKKTTADEQYGASSVNSLETETNHSERAIVAHFGPERQVQPNISYPELRLVASIRFPELDWATQFLSRIAPRYNGRKMMEDVARLYPVEEHLQQVTKSAWDNVSAQMNIFEEWLHFRKEGLIGARKITAIVLSEDNLETVTASEKKNCDHQGPVPSNMQLALPTPTYPSTLQFMDTTTQTLTTLSTRVSSLDLTCARINDDTNLTRHHTALLREQLTNSVDGLESKLMYWSELCPKGRMTATSILPSWKLLWFATMLIATSSWLTSWLQ